MPQIDWNVIVGSVVNNILIPELMAFIKTYRDRNGVDPTIAIVREALAQNVTAGLSLWEEWFKNHPVK